MVNRGGALPRPGRDHRGTVTLWASTILWAASAVLGESASRVERSPQAAHSRRAFWLVPSRLPERRHLR